MRYTWQTPNSYITYGARLPVAPRAQGATFCPGRYPGSGTQIPDDALHGHEDGVEAVAISHDCWWFVTGSDDKTLRLWELPSGKAIGQRLLVIQKV